MLLSLGIFSYGRRQRRGQHPETTSLRVFPLDYDLCCPVYVIVDSGATRETILHSACAKYEEIVKAGGASHDVHYNWGVALR